MAFTTATVQSRSYEGKPFNFIAERCGRYGFSQHMRVVQWLCFGGLLSDPNIRTYIFTPVLMAMVGYVAVFM
jgi:hypothetical protein